jgi:hypothetical protein
MDPRSSLKGVTGSSRKGTLSPIGGSHTQSQWQPVDKSMGSEDKSRRRCNQHRRRSDARGKGAPGPELESPEKSAITGSGGHRFAHLSACNIISAGLSASLAADPRTPDLSERSLTTSRAHLCHSVREHLVRLSATDPIPCVERTGEQFRNSQGPGKVDDN